MVYTDTNVTPTDCCSPGDYDCQVPMPISRRIEYIDFCIADIIAALNAANIITIASCCGHGLRDASIILEDGREIAIKNVPRYWMNHKKEKLDTWVMIQD